MNSHPKVSIIMNCYNGEKFLKEAIDSIYEQTYPFWEIIFWDNNSDDRSAAIALSYDSRLKYFKSDVTTSLGMARNNAIMHATGTYLAFLDTDDRYHREKLSLQVRTLDNSDFSLIYSSVNVIDEDGRLIRVDRVKSRHGFLINDLLMRYEINMQSVMMKKIALDESRLSFDPNLFFSPDYDLFMRIALNYPVCAMEAVLVDYRKVKNSLTNKSLRLIPQEMQYTLNHLVDLDSFNKITPSSLMFARRIIDSYKSLYALEQNDYSLARKLMLNASRSKRILFSIYILLFIPFTRSLIFKLMIR